ncbi:MAG: biopolymer transporter ExbD [Pseudomonadota bacterium]
MTRRRRSKNKDDIEVNVVPLVDVVFVLLLFFMVSTTFNDDTRLSLKLPEAEGQPVTTEFSTVEVVVNAQGDYAINGKPLVNRTRQTLMSALSSVVTNKQNIKVILTADAQAPHQAVVTVMDAAGRLGIADLQISTRAPDAKDS